MGRTWRQALEIGSFREDISEVLVHIFRCGLLREWKFEVIPSAFILSCSLTDMATELLRMIWHNW